MIDPGLIPGGDVEKFLEGIHFQTNAKGDIIPIPRDGSPYLQLIAGRKYRFILTPKDDTPSDDLTAPASDN